MQSPWNLCVVALVASSVLLPAQKNDDPGAARLAAQRAAAAQAEAGSAAWQEFQRLHGGEWLSMWCAATGTPSAIYGPGLPIVDWQENTLDAARRHAGDVLQQQRQVLGLGTSEFREVIGARVGRQWSFVFDQFHGGLPVIGGRADVRVSMAGRVAMFGATAWPIPATFDSTPAIGAEVATAAAWQALGQVPTGVAQPGKAAAPRLVIWGDVDAVQRAPSFLCWEVAVSNVGADGQGVIGRYYIDARTAAVRHFQNDKHECGIAGCTGGKHLPAAPVAAAPVNTTVTVMGWTRIGIDGYGPATNVPLPGLELNVPGVGAVVTDQNGQFTIDIAAPVSITVGAFDGRHHDTMLGVDAPSGSFTVNPGVPATIQIWSASSTVNQVSHTTVSYWVDAVNEYSRAILGNSAELNVADAVVPRVNMASTCNAYYTSNTINFYNAGGGCSNTANATVVAHEWGHGIDDRYGGISQTNGLSEGWGDIMGMYLVDSPDLGLGFMTVGVPLRSGNNTQQYPGGSGVHAQGQSWMGFAWKLRDRLAITYANRAAAVAITDDIVVSTLAADATDQQAAVLEVFLADDNDGILGNGTPNYADLVWACQQHSLPYPGLTIPSNDDCAGAFTVSNGVSGPYTSVLSTTSSAWPCANIGADVWFKYYVGASGSLTISTCNQTAMDTGIEIFVGACGSLTSIACLDDSCGTQTSLTVPVTPGIVYFRVGGYNAATGSFSLDVSGPQGAPASIDVYGEGCYRSSTAFYEEFGSGGFDLSGASLQLINTGGQYLGTAGGVYVAPSGSATLLTLSDDSQTSVGLAGSFSYPGGTTTSLMVCSNGFVSVASGNGTGFTPSASAWLGSSQHRWGTWHDFNPAASGGGRVKFEQVGNIAYVTWDGVYSYGTSAANTFQLQFDLGTGNVTYVWPTMVASGNGWLVGMAGAAPNNDLGSMDLSTALTGTFRTGVNSDPLTLAATLPQLGASVTLTTTLFPAGSFLGAQILSLVRHDPGIDLTSVGMPGCYRLIDLDAVNIVLPAGGQATFVMAIPNDNAFQGLPIGAQTWAFASGANALGVVNSNGVRLIVGQ